MSVRRPSQSFEAAPVPASAIDVSQDSCVSLRSHGKPSTVESRFYRFMVLAKHNKWDRFTVLAMH